MGVTEIDALALTLLVESNPKIVEIYQLNLATYVGLEVFVAANTADALAALKTHPFELIISRAKIKNEDCAVKIAEAMEKDGKKIPLFVIGHGLYPSVAKSTLPGGLDLKGVVKGAASALGVTAHDMAKKKVEDHFPIPISYLLWLTHPVCDLLQKKDDGSMVVLFSKAHSLDKEKLPAKGFLYVDKMFRLQIVEQITAELVVKLEDKDLNEDEQIQAGESNMELLSKKLVTIGITEETISLARKNIRTMTANVKAYPQLGKLLQRMLQNDSGLVFKHTQIVTYVSLHIVHNIDWGTPEQEEKMAFIAFFHDIFLQNDKQGAIHTAEELRKSDLPVPEKALVEKHAQLAAEVVQKYPHAPMGSDQIIKQHHGMLNGVGFADHFGANLSPMAIVFIVAEEFTRIAMSAGAGPFNTQEMVRSVRHQFPSSRFQKIIDNLEKIIF